MVQLTIGKVRLSYLHVFEPYATKEGDDKRYSASILIPKSDKTLVSKIKQAIEDVKKDQTSLSKWGGKIPSNLKTPLRDGDVERPDEEAYTKHFFMGANSVKKPGLVDLSRAPIVSQDELQSGDYGYVNISIYAFNFNGTKGIACGLNHIMKTETGERLAGGISVEEAFADINVDDLM